MNTDISDKLISSLPEILPRLYPLGKIKGKEFMIGNLLGEVGDSLRINIRTGVWCDFSSPNLKGKIIGFFAARNGSYPEGMKEIAQLLKLPPPVKSIKYKKPKTDWQQVDCAAAPIKYLIRERGIPKELLLQSKIRWKDDEYIFLGIDEEGVLAYAQYTKIKRDEKGKKQVRFSLSPKLCLWGMDSVTEHFSSIIVTEGVIDALSFRANGHNAVSIPSGVSSTEWIELSWNFLSQYESIIISFDSDEPGQKAATLVAGRLGVARCKNLRFKAKDANDAHLNKESFEEAIANCSDFFPTLFLSGNDIREKVWNEVLAGPQENVGSALFGWTGKSGPRLMIRGGECTIWTGYAGSGKSTALLQHAAHAICIEGKKIALASLEVPSITSLIRMLTQACGFFLTTRESFDDVYARIADNIFLYDCLGSAPLASLLEFFEYSISRHGVNEVILDSLMRTDIDIDGERSRVAQMFQSIIDSCGRTGAHYHIVAHATKGSDIKFEEIPSMNSVKGIQEVVANVHNVIVCWQNKIKHGTIEGLIRKGATDQAFERDREWGDSRFVICKNRTGQVLGKIEAWFNSKNYRFREQFDQDSDIPYIEL